MGPPGVTTCGEELGELLTITWLLPPSEKIDPWLKVSTGGGLDREEVGGAGSPPPPSLPPPGFGFIELEVEGRGGVRTTFCCMLFLAMYVRCYARVMVREPRLAETHVGNEGPGRWGRPKMKSTKF